MQVPTNLSSEVNQVVVEPDETNAAVLSDERFSPVKKKRLMMRYT